MTTNTATVLTPRDHGIFQSLLEYRYLSASQLQRLHFPSQQTAARRLRVLTATGHVATFRAPGIEERLTMLTDRGAHALAEQRLVPVESLGWTGQRLQPKDYLFLKHFLAAADFRIAVSQACAVDGDLELVGFIPEHRGTRSQKGTVDKYTRDTVHDTSKPGARITHTPDGVFALARAGKAAIFFLEIDRGTEVLAHAQQGFLKTIRFYLSYLVSEGYQRYRDDFGAVEPFKPPRVLILTTSERRLENMRALAGNYPFEPAHAKRFLWAAPLSILSSPDLLTTPAWQTLEPSDQGHYAIVSSPMAGSASL